MKQQRIAKQILAMIDVRKRKSTFFIAALLLVLTFAGHILANNWESPLALIPRSFTGILIGYLILYLLSIHRYPLITKYFDLAELQKDAQQRAAEYPSAKGKWK